MTMDDFIGDFEIPLSKLMDGRSIEIHPSPNKNRRESRITNHESRIMNHESRIMNHESRITNHESRITNHES
jgi:hypothetical protein